MSGSDHSECEIDLGSPVDMRPAMSRATKKKPISYGHSLDSSDSDSELSSKRKKKHDTSDDIESIEIESEPSNKSKPPKKVSDTIILMIFSKIYFDSYFNKSQR